MSSKESLNKAVLKVDALAHLFLYKKNKLKKKHVKGEVLDIN